MSSENIDQAKFLLADPSIVGRGGHYLEYATRVLSAAEKMGFVPMLATNSALDAEVITSIPWITVPIFHFDIWGVDRRIKPPDIEAVTDEDRRILQLMVSRGGQYWAMAEELDVVRQYTQRTGLPEYALRR